MGGAAQAFGIGVDPEFPDYNVHATGRVFRRVDSRSGGWRAGREVKACASHHGYRVMGLIDVSGRKRMVRVNRLVCRVFHGEPPTPRHHAAHLDGDKTNNRADNLAWKTPRENVVEDRDRHGTTARGARNGFAKLTERDALTVHARVAAGERQVDVALSLGVHRGTVNKIVHRKSWRHVA